MVSRVMLNIRDPSLVTPGIPSSQLMSFECSRLEFAEGIGVSEEPEQ